LDNHSDISLTLNNKQDFKKLYVLFYPALYQFALKIVKNRFGAEDIVQEVFFNLWVRGGEFKTIQKVKSFLYTSVKNKCFDHLEHEAVILKHKKYSKNQEKSDKAIDYRIIEEETYRLIYTAINTLPPECRRILMLSIKGLQNTEIAKKMNISVNTVKTQKKIAYKHLRIQLKDIYFILGLLLNHTL
jgi:RNA polymerase sigma-70 factor (ECF subfamily)